MAGKDEHWSSQGPGEAKRWGFGFGGLSQANGGALRSVRHWLAREKHLDGAWLDDHYLPHIAVNQLLTRACRARLPWKNLVWKCSARWPQVQKGNRSKKRRHASRLLFLIPFGAVMRRRKWWGGVKEKGKWEGERRRWGGEGRRRCESSQWCWGWRRSWRSWPLEAGPRTFFTFSRRELPLLSTWSVLLYM